MGILDGKRILVAGVTMDSSIGFATAKVAQEQGATVLISNFGRALGITRRIAKRLPTEPPVLELDVTDPEHLERLPDLVREHVDGLDGVVHSIAYGNPETLLGGKFLGGPWDDVAQAVQVSAYSLKSLATACRPLMGPGRLRRRHDLRRDRRLAGVRLDGRRQGGAGVHLALPGPRPRRRTASACNLVAAGPLRTLAAKAIPGFEDLENMWSTRAPLGWDNADQTPTAKAVCALLSDFFPRDLGRDRPRRRRLPRDGGLSASLLRCPLHARPPPCVELRVLEGPNLYFPRAAIKLTLDVSGLAAASDDDAPGASPPGSGCATRARAPAESGFRQRFAARAVARLVRAVAAESGTARLAVRVRPTSDPHQLVVAFPWRAPGPGAGDGPRRRPTCSTRCAAGSRARTSRPR